MLKVTLILVLFQVVYTGHCSQGLSTLCLHYHLTCYPRKYSLYYNIVNLYSHVDCGMPPSAICSLMNLIYRIMYFHVVVQWRRDTFQDFYWFQDMFSLKKPESLVFFKSFWWDFSTKSLSHGICKLVMYPPFYTHDKWHALRIIQ